MTCLALTMIPCQKAPKQKEQSRTPILFLQEACFCGRLARTQYQTAKLPKILEPNPGLRPARDEKPTDPTKEEDEDEEEDKEDGHAARGRRSEGSLEEL